MPYRWHGSIISTEWTKDQKQIVSQRKDEGKEPPPRRQGSSYAVVEGSSGEEPKGLHGLIPLGQEILLRGFVLPDYSIAEAVQESLQRPSSLLPR